MALLNDDIEQRAWVSPQDTLDAWGDPVVPDSFRAGVLVGEAVRFTISTPVSVTSPKGPNMHTVGDLVPLFRREFELCRGRQG